MNKIKKEEINRKEDKKQKLPTNCTHSAVFLKSTLLLSIVVEYEMAQW